MRRVAGPLAATLVALLLAASLPVAATGDPHPRKPDFDAGAPVTALAMGVLGSYVVGTDDLGSNSPLSQGDADQAVWHVVDAAGVLQASGDADYGAASGCAGRLRDDCRAPVTAVAIDAAGARAAVASALSPSPADSHGGQVLVVDTQDARRTTVQLPERVRAMAMASDGGRLVTIGAPAAVTDGTAVGTVVPVQSTIRFWTLSGTAASPTTEVEVEGAPRSLAASRDGSHAIIATRQAVARVSSSGAAPTILQAPASEPAAVAISPDGTWTMSVHRNGDVALYSQAAPEPLLLRRPGGPGTAAAMAQGASWFAAGDETGKLHLFSRAPGTGGKFEATVDLASGPVTGLSWDDEGTLLVVVTGETVHLLERRGKQLASLWSADGAAPVAGFGTRSDANLVAAARGDNVSVYQAVRRVSATAPALTLDPGAAGHADVTYRNTGNRPETLTLRVAGPVGWNVSADPLELELDVGASGTVRLEVQVPANATPAQQQVALHHQTRSGLAGRTDVGVAVAANRIVTLEPLGRDSAGVEPGSGATFQFRVRNDGNVEADIRLAATAQPAGWSATLQQSTLRLRPGQESDLGLVLLAPAQAPQGAQGTARVGESGTSGSRLEFVGTVGAHFAFDLDLPRGVLGVPGNTSVVQLRIHNTGNAPDSYLAKVDNGGLPPGWRAGFGGVAGEAELRQVEPQGREALPLHITVPPDAPANGVLNLQVVVHSLADPDRKEQRHLVVSMADGPGVPPPEETPGPGAAAVAALLVGVAVAARLRKQAQRF